MEKIVSCFRSTALWLVVSSLSLLTLVACNSGGGGGKGTAALQVSSGQFIDSIASGLEYSYPGLGISGITGDTGSFSVHLGEQVQFSIGGIVLGQATANILMTPVNLGSSNSVTDQVTTNIARFLQIIDSDADNSNGIQITADMRTAAAGMSINFNQTTTNFESDTNVSDIINTLTGGARSFADVSVVNAQTHLSDSITGEIQGMLATFNGTSFSDFTNCISGATDSVASGSITITYISATSPYSYQGEGSFSAKVSGITVREDMTFNGTVSIDGTMSGYIDSVAYQNGSYAG